MGPASENEANQSRCSGNDWSVLEVDPGDQDLEKGQNSGGEVVHGTLGDAELYKNFVLLDNGLHLVAKNFKSVCVYLGLNYKTRTEYGSGANRKT